MAERTIYQGGGALITTSKVMLGSTTYFLRNIASVRVTMQPNALAWMALTVGAMTAIIASIWLPDTWYVVLLGAAFIFGAFKLGFRIYALHFDMSSGSVQAYSGRPERLFMLKEQIEQAMSEAGV